MSTPLNVPQPAIQPDANHENANWLRALEQMRKLKTENSKFPPSATHPKKEKHPHG